MNLETLSSEQLAELRDKVIATLNDPLACASGSCRARSKRAGSWSANKAVDSPSSAASEVP